MISSKSTMLTTSNKPMATKSFIFLTLLNQEVRDDQVRISMCVGRKRKKEMRRAIKTEKNVPVMERMVKRFERVMELKHETV